MKKKPPPRSATKRAAAKRRPPPDATAEFEERMATPPSAQLYTLRLFVTGSSPRSSAAVATIRAICDEYLTGNYDLEVVDIYQQPAAAVSDQIIAAPTLIKQQPHPVRRMVGSLADRHRVLAGLDLPPSEPPPTAATRIA